MLKVKTMPGESSYCESSAINGSKCHDLHHNSVNDKVCALVMPLIRVYFALLILIP